MTNMAIGTPDFVAPESLEMGRPVDHRADLYAVGVMFYQMLTGALPRGNFRPPSGRVESLDPRLDDVVAKAMESDPEDRYADASAFRAAIDAILAEPIPEATETTGPVTPSGRKLNLGPVTRPEEKPEPESAPVVSESEKNGRGPLLWVALALLLVFAVVAGIIFTGGDDATEAENLAGSPPALPVSDSTPDSANDREPASPPVPERSTPAEPPTPQSAPEPSPDSPAFTPIDLMAEVDRELLGENRIEEDRIETIANVPLVFDLPESIQNGEGYVLEIIVASRQANGFSFSLPFQSRRLSFSVDVTDEDGLRKTEMNLAEGVENASARNRQGQEVRIFHPARLEVSVSREKITLGIDGETIIEHEGPPSDYRYDWAPLVNDEEQRGRALLAFYGPYTVHRMRLLPLDAEIGPVDLSQFSRPPSPEPGGPDERESAPGSPPAPAPGPLMPEQEEADPVADRLAEIDRKYRQVFEGPYEKSLGQLNRQFTGALKREEKAASETGDLDLVLAFQEESKRIENGDGAGPADAASIPPRLAQLRATWHAQHDKLSKTKAGNQKKAHAARDQALGLYQQELVKARDIAAAQRVKAAREALHANPGADLAETGAGNGGWITLFDGDTLDGWKAVGGPRAFQVSSGAIRGRREKGLLYFEGDSPEAGKFRDFEFHAQVRTKNAINGGIFFHKDLAEESHAGSGIEAQVANQNRDRRKTGSLYQLADINEIIVSDGEWFDYGIRSQGEQVTISINGEVVNEWTRPANFDRNHEGHFALQSNPSGPNDPGEIFFRDIRVRRLSESKLIATAAPPSPRMPPAGNAPPRGGNPSQPVITSPPERVYPPKRPQRTGELITAPLFGGGEEIRVVSRDIVDFRVNGPGAFALNAAGRIEKHGDQGSPVFLEFDKVAEQLTDIVSFDVVGNGTWAVALDAKGKTILWGRNSNDGMLLKGPEEGNQLVQVFLPSFAYGLGLTRSGGLVQWPSNLNHFKDARSIAHFERATNAQILLTDRGRLEAHGDQWPEHFSEEERDRLEGIRNAVRIASTPGDARLKAAPTLVLLDTGEVVPAGWPRDRYPDGNPLPPDLPRDIERIQVAILPLAGNAREAIGGILSRSRGWIFLGAPEHAEPLAAKARGCFRFEISGQEFWGLRPPKPIATSPPPDR